MLNVGFWILNGGLADSMRRRIFVIISPVTLATLVGHLRGYQNYFFNIFLRSFWNAKHVETANGNSKADAGNCVLQTASMSLQILA